MACAAGLSTGKAATQPASADFAPICSLPVIAGRTISYESDHKKRAIADYVANMRPQGGSLSCHGRHLLKQTPRFNSPFDFDVLIIGSSYGASVCAARLAMAKRPETRLAIIERGREWIPGTFSDTLRNTTKESRFKLLGRHKNTVDNPVGLVNAMQNDEVNVLSGSGLCGSSLINASVAIRPEPAVFDQSCWPEALHDPMSLDRYYGRAAWELGAGVGPTIQTNLTFPNRAQLKDRVLIQDGSVSRAYANILGLLMRDMNLDQTLVMLGMGHDGANGRMILGQNRLGSVKWPGLKDSPYRQQIRSDLAKVAKGHGGKYKYLKIFGDNFITVHPLGGCAMSDDPDGGVVDQPFSRGL